MLAFIALPSWLVFHGDINPDSNLNQTTHKLRMLTINGPTTFYRSADGPSGFEYELAMAFGKYLGKDLEVEIVDSVASVLPRLERGDVHFAAGIILSDDDKQKIQMSMPYQKAHTSVVYRHGKSKPNQLEDLIGKKILISAESIYSEHMTEWKQQYPELEWSESRSVNQEDLLLAVSEDNADITLVDSNLAAVLRQHYPGLKIAFNPDIEHELAWIFPDSNNQELMDLANRFIQHAQNNQFLPNLFERYYGSTSVYNYVNIATYRRRIKTVLPEYEKIFKEAGAEVGLDWRLIAAQAYQESYWNPASISPTGVKGIMQLTRATAKRMKVTDRKDPKQSIFGGARYLRLIHDQIPDSVPEPDRTWFALAAYNIGPGHLQDARALAKAQGKNSNQWTDVKTTLNLLSEKQWHSQTKYGYARGYEAVSYVNRIRSFYDILSELKTDPAKTFGANLELLTL